MPMTTPPTATPIDNDRRADELLGTLFRAATAVLAHALPPDIHHGTASLLRKGATIDVTVTLPTSDAVVFLHLGDRYVELARITHAVGGTA